LQYPATGIGLDLAYLIHTDISCDLSVTMLPTGSDDLSLYVLSPDCSDEAGNCVRVSDDGGIATPETVTFTTGAGQPFYIIVDGYDGEDGPFELTIDELGSSGCRLVEGGSYGLGGLVWNDKDRDGIQDSGEDGVENIDVELYNNGACSGSPVGSDWTLPWGDYEFPSESPGTYCLEFSVPSGWIISPQDQGSDDTRDSDADPATGRITDILLSTDRYSHDLGIYQPGSVERIYVPIVRR
jgi:hypothetical protein